VADSYSRWRAAHSPDIDPDVLQSNCGSFAVSDPALQLSDVLDPVKQDTANASQKVNDLIGNTRVGDDVGSQIAAQRFWARAQRTLDATKDAPKAVAAAQELINSASDAETPVLAEELSSYLASRSLPTDWLSGAVASKIPGLSDAAADSTLKARQLAVLQRNHSALTNAFAKDTAAPQLLDPSTMTSEPYTGG
jgi:hypothetical protein